MKRKVQVLVSGFTRHPNTFELLGNGEVTTVDADKEWFDRMEKIGYYKVIKSSPKPEPELQDDDLLARMKKAK